MKIRCPNTYSKYFIFLRFTLVYIYMYIQDTVRNDVAATSGINKVWMRRYQVSELNDYIIRRFIATPSGVFRTFPGILFDKTYDPIKQPW